MTGNQRSPAYAPEPPETGLTGTESRTLTVPGGEIMELLGDEYTRRVLGAVLEQPRTGREVVDAAEVSKATAYRRLDSLQDAGLVETDVQIDPNGYHRKRFRAVVEGVAFDLDADGVTARLRPSSDTSPPVSGQAESESWGTTDD
jgi:DNA-binding transcriptional ArsR family regulator